jgi:hypothetical protein
MDSTTTQARGTRLVTAGGLVIGAAGIVLQRFAGVDMPVVPPGLVLLVVVAALIAFTGWRWIPAVGVVLALVEIAVVLVGSATNLIDVDPVGLFLATWARAIGVVIAIIAGVAATVAGLRRSSSATRA